MLCVPDKSWSRLPNPLKIPTCVSTFIHSQNPEQSLSFHPSAPGLFPAEWKVRQSQGISSGLAFFCLPGADSEEETVLGHLRMTSSKAAKTIPLFCGLCSAHMSLQQPGAGWKEFSIMI